MLAKCTVAMTVTARSKFCYPVSGCDSNFHFQNFFDFRDIILFLNFTVVLTLKLWTLNIVVSLRKINYFSGEITGISIAM